MDGILNINFYYVFTFFNFFGVFMIVGLVGEAVVIAEDFHPLIPRLFLSPTILPYVQFIVCPSYYFFPHSLSPCDC